jgi:hypothetical protein
MLVPGAIIAATGQGDQPPESGCFYFTIFAANLTSSTTIRFGERVLGTKSGFSNPHCSETLERITCRSRTVIFASNNSIGLVS